MNIRILLTLAALLSVHTVPCRASDDVFWWRLDQETAPYQSVVGESPLYWWSDTKTPEASSTEVPPSTLYRHPATPPLRVFDSGKSHQGDCALQLKQGGAAFSNVETGLTVEGFFRTTPLKSEHERQALVSCGEGYADIAWIVFLRDGHPSLPFIAREATNLPQAWNSRRMCAMGSGISLWLASPPNSSRSRSRQLRENRSPARQPFPMASLYAKAPNPCLSGGAAFTSTMRHTTAVPGIHSADSSATSGSRARICLIPDCSA